MFFDQRVQTAMIGLHHPLNPIVSFCQPGWSLSVAVVYMTVYINAYLLLQPMEYKQTAKEREDINYIKKLPV